MRAHVVAGVVRGVRYCVLIPFLRVCVQDEEKVNWMVQQWLQERGFTRALKALQEVCARR